jgi:hypothetical protein
MLLLLSEGISLSGISRSNFFRVTTFTGFETSYLKCDHVTIYTAYDQLTIGHDARGRFGFDHMFNEIHTFVLYSIITSFY